MVVRARHLLLRVLLGVTASVVGTTMCAQRSARAESPQPTHWSLVAPVQSPPPTVADRLTTFTPVDLWVRARLDQERLAPSPPADRVTLLRRVTLDLTGVPPTVENVEEFLDDTGPDAYVRRVDRLLASPSYGEKWARPWLDLTHYADTDGYLTDQPRPVAWRYRQWLVDALNRDQRFDQFTVEQLAGDLLPNPTLDQRLATGLLRNTLSNREGGADLEEFRVEQVVDRVNMVGTIWLGLTLNCCRCHDHKYDPLTQQEFFALYALIDGADEVNIDAPLPGELEPYAARRAEYETRRQALLAPVAEPIAELQARWERRLLEAMRNPGRDHIWDRQWEVLGLIWGGRLGEGQLEGTQIVLLDPARRTPSQKARLLDYFLKHGSLIDSAKFTELKLSELSGKLDTLAKEFPQLARAPTMIETANPRPVFVHVGGDFRVVGDRVTPEVPAVLPRLPEPVPSESARNRLALARWLVSPEHPLTARVTVNRLWQELFGRGLVLTSDDFGRQGQRPTHPELLDWLAVELRGRGTELDWSVKRLVRELVGSATYRQSSRTRPDLQARDPNNQWLARQTALRLTADQVRDATLAASGLLTRRIGGPSVFPPQPASVVSEAFENDWKESQGGDCFRRGLYTYLQRLSPFAQQVTFDAPPLGKSCARRERSNTPLQSLTLLNDPVFFEAARALAERVENELPNAAPEQRVERMFRHCVGRGPTDRERRRLIELHRQQAELSSDSAAWTIVASVVLNLHEFLVRE